MNLATNYLGLKLRSPLIVGASPFCDDVDREIGRASCRERV